MDLMLPPRQIEFKLHGLVKEDHGRVPAQLLGELLIVGGIGIRRQDIGGGVVGVKLKDLVDGPPRRDACEHGAIGEFVIDVGASTEDFDIAKDWTVRSSGKVIDAWFVSVDLSRDRELRT